MSIGQRLLLTCRVSLISLLVAAFAALLRFAFWGSFQWIVPVHSPINAEGLIAVAFLLLCFLPRSSSHGSHSLAGAKNISVTWSVAAIAVLSLVAFAVTLNAPLLHDSYGHVYKAARETFAEALATAYQHPREGDFFFRPLGYLSYWIDYQWAGTDAFRWHAWNLAVHVANSLLVYTVGRQLSLKRFAATVAGVLFAIHGSRPEVVSWVAARFDLLAALFVLLALVAFNHYLETGRTICYGAMLLSCILALLSKESAYCLPLLLAALIPFKPSSSREAIVKGAAAVSGVTAIVFLYRNWVLGGIGGYRTNTGGAAILDFHLIHTAKALLFREWAILFFPVNWSGREEWLVQTAIVLSIAALGGLLVYSRVQRKCLLACIALVLAASLPVQHLLLISQDLAGSRVLYLPSLGMCFFWAFLLQGCSGKWLTLSLSAGLVASQFLMLQHNLHIWKRAAYLSQQTCRSLGEELSRTGGNVTVAGLPATWNGIFFLKNAFPQCVAMNSNASAAQVTVQDQVSPCAGTAQILVWDPTSDELKPSSR